LKNLDEKIEVLEKKVSGNNKRVEELESILIKNINNTDILELVSENSLVKYFYENVMKNIEKREEEKMKNKMLLEKVMVLVKKLKKIKEKEDNIFK